MYSERESLDRTELVDLQLICECGDSAIGSRDQGVYMV